VSVKKSTCKCRHCGHIYDFAAFTADEVREQQRAVKLLAELAKHMSRRHPEVNKQAEQIGFRVYFSLIAEHFEHDDKALILGLDNERAQIRGICSGGVG